MHKSEEKNYIFGIRAIIEAVQAGKTIDKLFIQKGLHNDLFAELWKLVREKRINYKHVPLENQSLNKKKSPRSFCVYLANRFS
jgi:23S rRNA (guanosine2251-2'-O)-methyltransferase